MLPSTLKKILIVTLSILSICFVLSIFFFQKFVLVLLLPMFIIPIIIGALTELEPKIANIFKPKNFDFEDIDIYEFAFEESFIIRYNTLFNINWLLENSEIPKEFEKDIDWFKISYYNKLSKDFLVKYKNKLHKFNLSRNKYISKEIIEEVFGKE